MLIKGNSILTSGIQNILLIQLGDIGDVVLSFPAIRALRENFPDANVIVAVREKAKELIEDCPWASDVISINKTKRNWVEEVLYQKSFFSRLRRFKIDLAIDLRTGTRGAILAFLSGSACIIGRFAEDGRLWRNRLFTHLVRPENELNQYAAEHNLNIISPLDLDIRNRIPNLDVPPERKEKAFDILKQENVPLNKPVIAIHPFSLWKYKEWGISQCVSLIDHINTKYNISVIITGSLEERINAQEVVTECNTSVFNLAGKTSIAELAGVLEECLLFIGVDTAALHVAAAVGIPTVGIFGPSSPTNWAPRGDQHCVVSKNMSCVPCMQKGCQNSERSRCLEDLTFGEIREKVDERMDMISS